MGFWALCFNSRVLPQSLSFCWRSGWRCYPHFSLHTLVATVVAYSSHNLVCRDMVMSMQWGYITIFCPPARVNPLARVTLPPCKQAFEPQINRLDFEATQWFFRFETDSGSQFVSSFVYRYQFQVDSGISKPKTIYDHCWQQNMQILGYKLS